MENASKALIITASVLIGLMLLSMMVFVFKRFGDTAKTTDKKFSQRDIDSFNAKFVNYETGGNHNLEDTFSITYARTNSSSTVTKDYKYKDFLGFPSSSPSSSGVPGGLDRRNYYKALGEISQTLDRASNVVTAINDAIDVNDRNNNNYKYDSLEVQNSVEVIVDLGASNNFEFSKIRNGSSHFRYLLIEPNSNVKEKYAYGTNTIETTKSDNTKNKNENVKKFVCENDSSSGNYNAVKVYDILEELRDTKVSVIAEENNRPYTLYKYYFMGEVIFNEYTELVETVKFTLVQDKNFDKKDVELFP